MIALLVLLTLGAGCGRQELDDTYGRRRGALGGSSVNGTAVLAGLFERAGHKVKTWRRLSPKLGECDAIVWAPNSFAPPALEERQFLEAWLAEGSFRTLVYIGRDYDASITYWQKVRPIAPADQLIEVSRRLANARAGYEADRAQIPSYKPCDWFTIERDAARKKVSTLKGPWSAGIDVTKTEIDIRARLNPPNDKEKKEWHKRDDNHRTSQPQFEALLATEDDIDIVTRVTRRNWHGGQIVVVANGSFLLNLPLVNHEHRKLADRLISACAPAGKTVFLESGPGGPIILDQEPDANAPTGFEVLTKWPIGIIALHLIILGTTLCFAYYPLFGRSKDVKDELRSDFGRHVNALGDLLESTQDHQYAANKIRTYHEHTKRDPASGHRGKK